MTLHILLLLPLVARCLGQENPCEGISLGSCLVEEESILNTYSARPDKCSELCDMNNNCEFWKARWDGTLCHLLISDYRHDCGSFAGPINWGDCPEGDHSCHAYVGDDCVYTGERIKPDEPNPGDVGSIEGCRIWAEFWVGDGAAFFHYNSTSEDCHLYRTLDSDCHSVGGPKAAPSFDQCICPEGWTLAGSSCYFLSTEIISTFNEAVTFCKNLGSTLVEANTEPENAVLVAMAEEALAIDNYIERDYWMGGVKTGDGTWKWLSGDPMEYTNWCKGCLDQPEGWNCLQLLKKGYPGILDTYYWARDDENSGTDNGVICEMNMGN